MKHHNNLLIKFNNQEKEIIHFYVTDIKIQDQRENDGN